ncbi:HEC/Ndc80p family-domain-containing protein [Chytriomyces cf. hyalinus JEL632]|nr:HEC/Ndc80p family-domain-containing protein [Chytriomyces cf. hyalinus JEL632]
MSQLPNTSRMSLSRKTGLADSLAGLSLRSSLARGTVSSTPGGLAGVPGMGRRSSAYQGRPSTLSTAPLVITKDPRPIRDKAWQASAIRNLISFLVNAGFNQQVSPKTLQAPSMKDFTAIFKFLYAQLDPNYAFVKKFEEEVPVILKGLRYPFSDQISKSHLASVGSMHAWPTLLAMLTWMVELILCCDQMDNTEAFDDEASSPERQAEKVFFQYLTRAYKEFLAGDDNYDAMADELVSFFDRKDEQTVRDIEKLKLENEALTKELAGLRDSESPLTLAEREGDTLSSDIEKFKQYIAHLELKKQKLQDQVNVVEEELSAKESELDKQTIEKNELTSIVDNQELSPADVDRMTSEREQLVRTLEALAAKSEETNKTFWEKEMAVQKQMDALEKCVQKFNTLAYDVGFLSRGGAGSREEDQDTKGVNFELELNFSGKKAEDMVSVDLQAKIKPILIQIRSKYNASAHAFEDETIIAQEQLDRLSEACAEKCDELMQLESKILKLNEQFTKEKEVYGATNTEASKQMEVIEQEIQRMKLDASNALTLSQQRVQKASMELDELCHKFNEAKDRVEKSVFRVLEGLVVMKEKVVMQFSDLKAAVNADYEEFRTSSQSVI